MLCFHPGPALLLYDLAATRQFEDTATASLPAHTLMQRAGLSTARLALALAPHARHIWVACGPGNNGGDGLEAALQLQLMGKTPVVTWLGNAQTAPADATASHARALVAGVAFATEPPAKFDLCIDALLGIGTSRPAQGLMAEWIAHINALSAPVLAIDLPSGLNSDTGSVTGPCVQASHTLSLLTLKPGLFTGMGRDHSGEVWFESLSDAPCDPIWGSTEPCAVLNAAPIECLRAHASHKGSYGDVAVIGGAPGMTGAPLLAARAALQHGAGRIFVSLLDGGTMAVDTTQPELMFRPIDALEIAHMTAVCGCGGGVAIAAHLGKILSTTPRLVLDADALNSIATDAQLEKLLKARQSRNLLTVLTPHPLEAARLLGMSTSEIQHNRLAAAEQLAQRMGCTVVLKGSGSIIASPGERSVINPTGNARLATAGTGDVLAGMIGARLAAGASTPTAAHQATCEAVYLHGLKADQWPSNQPLTAGELTRH
jgi:ADP-dependent NAD(P)H-hydrate dehydratase / NAD(P)H-hydrate epimerase